MSETDAASNGQTPPATLEWIGEIDGCLRLIDQTLLPTELRYRDCTTLEDVWEAIRSLCVRGAPAIGVSAAYGIVLGLQNVVTADRDIFDCKLREVTEYLATSRPTAVNLFWALDRMTQHAGAITDQPTRDVLTQLLQEARNIEREDREMCAEMGRVGAKLLHDGQGVLTHCNAGGLATAGDGTALSVIFSAVKAGKRIHVYADETRPLLQGARLTTWELMQRNIPVTLICDSAAGWVMQERRVQAVVTGADRIAANGDVANKIGTYTVATLARSHGIPFYVAAPSSTFDLSLENGEQIPIELRTAAEITEGFGKRTAPPEVETYNPAFDVTPAELVSAIVTEQGLIQPVDAGEIRKVLGR